MTTFRIKNNPADTETVFSLELDEDGDIALFAERGQVKEKLLYFTSGEFYRVYVSNTKLNALGLASNNDEIVIH